MKLKKEDRVMAFITSVFILFVFAAVAYAGGGHQSDGVVNNYETIIYETYLTEETINNSITNVYTQAAKRAEVRAAAAGQTNYKATDELQWNIGTSFNDIESALHVGFGYQLGKVFVSGGITDTIDKFFTSEADPLTTINASGTF